MYAKKITISLQENVSSAHKTKNGMENIVREKMVRRIV